MDIDRFKLHPSGSLVGLNEQERLAILKLFNLLPSHVRRVLTDDSTGAYVTGLAKNHAIPDAQAHLIARSIMRLVSGYTPKPDFEALLMKELPIDATTAKKLVTEIETDLLQNFSAELDVHWKNLQKEQAINRRVATQNQDNILNLKQQG